MLLFETKGQTSQQAHEIVLRTSTKYVLRSGVVMHYKCREY